jgi:hypothetical protein
VHTQEKQSPYFRQIHPVYDEKGNVLPEDSYIVNGPYFRHLQKDLDACYGETN